jgi:hypothetical protein
MKNFLIKNDKKSSFADKRFEISSLYMIKGLNYIIMRAGVLSKTNSYTICTENSKTSQGYKSVIPVSLHEKD